MRVCRVPGCGRPGVHFVTKRVHRAGVNARGHLQFHRAGTVVNRNLCAAHAQRRARHGDENLQKCRGCRRLHENPELHQGGTLCDSCLAAVRCRQCDTPLVNKDERSRRVPLCSECRGRGKR